MSPSANVAKSYVRRTYARWQKLHTWQTWVLVCAAGAGATLCFNLSLAIWTSASGLKNGVATIKKGDCRDIKKSELWLHLGINVLSTMLLGGSNYTMQCLSAPTREEIDKGHHSRVTLDVGIPSLKNLIRASRRKIILWGFLAVSSVPLHLLYNSAVFSTLSTHSYKVFVVTPEFLSGADLGVITARRDGKEVLEQEITDIHNSVITAIQDPSKTKWQNMTNEKCLEAYQTEFISDRSHLLAVSSKGTRESRPVLEIISTEAFSNTSQSFWACDTSMGDFCQNADFQIYGYDIDYCLSKLEDGGCQLQLSVMIMTIVIICNLVKALCMILTVRSCFATPLLNLGDAIESFLKKPDFFTVNNCLSNKQRYQANRLVQSQIYSGDIVSEEEL